MRRLKRRRGSKRDTEGPGSSHGQGGKGRDLGEGERDFGIDVRRARNSSIWERNVREVKTCRG